MIISHSHVIVNRVHNNFIFQIHGTVLSNDLTFQLTLWYNIVILWYYIVVLPSVNINTHDFKNGDIKDMAFATNAASMRDSNRKLILNLLRIDPMSRADLAEKTHLTRASITLIIDELISDGLVEEVSTIESEALGRKRTRLAICHNARYAFGVHIQRKNCSVGICDLYGDIVRQESFDTLSKAPGEVIKDIGKRIRLIQDQCGIPDALILGIGISAPGPIDYESGVILNPPNFKGWSNIPVCDMLTKLTGYTAILEKDANARTIEERFFGAARDCESFLLIQVRSGVGAGVMVRDKLYRGSRGLGAELGHVSLNANGPTCSCGNHGCLENYFLDILTGSRFASWDELAKDAKSPDAKSILDRAAEYFSVAIINAFNLYDIEKVIIVGKALGNARSLLVERINRYISDRILVRKNAEDALIVDGITASSCRTGATAMLYSVFCDRG